ncbi:Uncharacterised protein [Mycobacteroides abscessus subsp. abscessus]|nr:Uncharacterised protein [Mycobacteroides abscessus subsp. abscessus]
MYFSAGTMIVGILALVITVIYNERTISRVDERYRLDTQEKINAQIRSLAVELVRTVNRYNLVALSANRSIPPGTSVSEVVEFYKSEIRPIEYEMTSIVLNIELIDPDGQAGRDAKSLALFIHKCTGDVLDGLEANNNTSLGSVRDNGVKLRDEAFRMLDLVKAKYGPRNES